MKVLATANPCVWDVPTSYLNQKSQAKQLAVLRKIKQPKPPTRQALTVNHNGTISTFTLGKHGEYFSKSGQSLTGLMEATAGLGNNKITIS